MSFLERRFASDVARKTAETAIAIMAAIAALCMLAWFVLVVRAMLDHVCKVW